MLLCISQFMPYFSFRIRPLGFDEDNVIQNKALVAIFKSERGQTPEKLRIFFIL